MSLNLNLGTSKILSQPGSDFDMIGFPFVYLLCKSFYSQQKGLQVKLVENWDTYQFSKAEISAFDECEFESFYFRALPLSILMGLGSIVLIRKDIMPTSKIWGPVPKVLIGFYMGYNIGKESYTPTCMDKFMAIPESKIGDMLRNAKAKSENKSK